MGGNKLMPLSLGFMLEECILRIMSQQKRNAESYRKHKEIKNFLLFRFKHFYFGNNDKHNYSQLQSFSCPPSSFPSSF